MPTTANPRVLTVLRVAQGEHYVGDILLDRKGRVWRHADSIPSDVVLKALVAHRRSHELFGQVIGLHDRRTYSWVVVGATTQAA